MTNNETGLVHQRFVLFAKKYYWELSEEKRRFLNYTDFVNELAKEYFEDYTEDTKKNCTQKVYRYFNTYVKSHPKYKILDTKVYIKLKNITDLFEIDYRRDTIKKALGVHYTYYSWVTNAEGEKTNKSICFVVIECAENVAENIYNTIGGYFDDLITNLFFGYKGVLITFDTKINKDKFLEYIKK